jgi:putative hydrolase of the HAD superfamily
VASHSVALLKPGTSIYAMVCRRLGIDPSEAIFVGDGGANELHGATQARGPA